MFKKIFFLALMAIMIQHSGASFAKENIDQNNTKFRSAQKSYSVQSYGIYLKPGELSQAYDELRGRYNWGYYLALAYDPKPDKNLYIKWYRYRANKENLQQKLDDLHSEGPANVRYGYTHDFDFVYLEFGQGFQFYNLFFQLHAGMEYVGIHIIQYANVTSNISRTTDNGFEQGRYSAFGPVFGIDLKYYISRHINLFIVNDVGILIHNAAYVKQNQQIDRTGPLPVNKTMFINTKLKGSTANILAETGLDYATPIKDGRLDLKFGWMAMIFDINGFRWDGAFFGGKWSGYV